MRYRFILGIVLIPALLLAGCGHKGPLMLPSPAPHASQPQIPVSPISDLPAAGPAKQP